MSTAATAGTRPTPGDPTGRSGDGVGETGDPTGPPGARGSRDGDDLVNVALLGTDRRPPADPGGDDPARVLLDRAARWAVARAAVVGREPCPAPEPAPAEARPAVPVAALDLLAEILRRPTALLLNLWLGEARAAGVGLPAEHWTTVLDAARRLPDLDRTLLAAGLGRPGRWFAAQNPGWERVVRSLPADGAGGGEPAGTPAGASSAAEPAGPAASPPTGDPPSVPDLPDLAGLRGDPDRALAVPDPWPADLVRTVLALLVEGSLPARAASAYGAVVGGRVPLGLHEPVTAVVERYRDDPAPPVRAAPWSAAALAPASRRAGLTALADVLSTRALLVRAFDPPGPDPSLGDPAAAGPTSPPTQEPR